jgi:hypothetical protein
LLRSALYKDGVEGEVDLSNLAGKGVFKAWYSAGVFEQVKIGTSGEIEWIGVGDLCPDALYLKLTGKPVEDYFPGLKMVESSA